MKQRYHLYFMAALLCGTSLNAQQSIDSLPLPKQNKPLVIEGYVDTYFCFDFNQPAGSIRPYVVSYSRHNEFNINLAYVSVKYANENIRAVFTPGFGTYMNANYAAERMTLKNIVEANAGFKLFKKKNVWLDAGVIPSPYTNENAISFDQINYSRSIAPEYVPYYLTGARLSLPLSKKVNANFYVINGWQQIEDVNSPLAFGSSVEFKPTNKLTLTWNTYYGDERSDASPDFSKRYFLDLYAVYDSGSKWVWSACAYYGIQEKGTTGNKTLAEWYQANAAVKYAFHKKHSLSGRVEYFNDPNQVMITPITGVHGFDAFSGTIGYNYHVVSQVMFRVEGRYFVSSKNVYQRDQKLSVHDNAVITAGITAKFN